MSETKKDYERLIEINTEIKGCINALEKAVVLNTASQEKESDRYFKIILALIAMMGGVLGLKLNFPQSATVGVASVMIGQIQNIALSIDWATTIINFSRFYTVFALIFTGGSIVREFWKNGFDRYLGLGFIIMGSLWLIQALGYIAFIHPYNVPFRLIYSTLFIIYSYNLGFRKKPVGDIEVKKH